MDDVFESIERGFEGEAWTDFCADHDADEDGDYAPETDALHITENP